MMRLFPTRQPATSRTSDGGVTLVELIVVLSLLGVVLNVAYALFFTTNRIGDAVEAQSQAADQTRLAVDRIARDVCGSVEATQGQGALLIAQPRQCAMYSEVDAGEPPELVTYTVCGQTLYRSVAQSVTTVPPYVFAAPTTPTALVTGLDPSWTGAVFVYYNDQSPPTQVAAGDCADISAVAIHLVNTATVGQSTVSANSSTWVKIRSVFNSLD